MRESGNCAKSFSFESTGVKEGRGSIGPARLNDPLLPGNGSAKESSGGGLSLSSLSVPPDGSPASLVNWVSVHNNATALHSASKGMVGEDEIGDEKGET
jgi:hypothetical protein